MTKKSTDKDDEANEEMRVADNRKVVVEDLVFIEDLEMIIYSTVAPKTSTVFITSLKKVDKCKKCGETQII